MTHNTMQALGREVDETSSVAGTKNSIAITQRIADELELVEGQQVTVTNLDATQKRQGRGRYLGAYTVREIINDDACVVAFGEKGRAAISGDDRFAAKIRDQVPDNTLSVEDARRLNEFTETAHFESPKVLVGGRVEKELRDLTADRLGDYLPSKYDYVTDRDKHSMMGGGGKNIVNWLTRDGGSGLQIESTPRNQQIRRKGVGRYVAHAVLEHRGLKDRGESQNPTAKPVLGATEMITLVGDDDAREVDARADAGAKRSCIDRDLAETIGVGPDLKSKKFRTSNGELVKRPIVELTVDVRGREHQVKPSIMDRSEMSTDFRLGRDILESNYRIDVAK